MKVTNLRIPAIDAFRGVALLAMAHFHFVFDLEMFGYVEPGTANSVPWKPYARGIATTFLMLVGFSLVLAYGAIRNPLEALLHRGFQKRFIKVAGAALLITVATYFAIPRAFIFFGILHQIALASVLGLLFVRLPWPITFVLAVGAFSLPKIVQFDSLVGLHGWWTGLASVPPLSNDFVPLFPWFGAVLSGIAIAQLANGTGALEKMAALKMDGRLARGLRWLGQHSLAFYLLHQPVMIGIIGAFYWFNTPA
jgi:uncharacterized membrane protein